ncbi:RICIN domain-containing protein [Kitasatospora cheerisanensis]|uniref:Ricin B lectin domain-containing protein n=1 Tax=Kitasatospora cheerisanensis KCTC 2395 TaxID=1348663 RepID=A0A066Z1M6_9ACTN|nr:RICIN domain-containing protein [Kitasatospora cheerisanensis]KDN87417.1 hypothetical protein KCH_07890 [Kitasatospora cheerisanensis KCTC 2395]
MKTNPPAARRIVRALAVVLTALLAFGATSATGATSAAGATATPGAVDATGVGPGGVTVRGSLIEGGTVVLVNQNTGRCIDDSLGYGLRAFGCNGLDYQQFTAHKWGDGTWELKNRNTQRCIDDSAGAGLRAFGCNALNYQSWFEHKWDDGTRELKNQNTGRCIEDSAGSGLRAQGCNALDRQSWYDNPPACGWTPANDSHDPGSFIAGPVNIRTGQSTICGVVGQAAQGDGAWIRCSNVNSIGETWFYLESNGKVGWVRSGSVQMGWTPLGC